ncbi:MAG TPA: hypothetical protein VIQ00_13765 [Chitinophagaceae bacterium]
MKQVMHLACLAVFIIFFVSCKKQKAQNTSTSIIGSWELRQTSAAMNPVVNNYSEGNGNIIKFSETNYEMYENGQLKKSGPYSVLEDTTVEETVCLVFPDGQFTNRIIYDNDYNASKIFLEISGNKLSFVSGCYAVDAGHRSEYERELNDR